MKYLTVIVVLIVAAVLLLFQGYVTDQGFWEAFIQQYKGYFNEWYSPQCLLWKKGM